MRHADFSPYYRSTIGFDRLFQLLDGATEADTYPPYNIERVADNQYRITMAVAGFGSDELKVDVKDTTLTVTGEKKPAEGERQFMHRGIATRTFERRFQLADYVEVKGADVENGLLNIELARHLPERMQPRTIEIKAGETAAKQLAAAE